MISGPYPLSRRRRRWPSFRLRSSTASPLVGSSENVSAPIQLQEAVSPSPAGLGASAIASTEQVSARSALVISTSYRRAPQLNLAHSWRHPGRRRTGRGRRVVGSSENDPPNALSPLHQPINGAVKSRLKRFALVCGGSYAPCPPRAERYGPLGRAGHMALSETYRFAGTRPALSMLCRSGGRRCERQDKSRGENSGS
jgi:hypothetical protein